MYKKIGFFICFGLPLIAQDIVGVWKLSNKEHPLKFSSAVSYEMNFQFNQDGTLQLLQNTANAFGSTRHYEVNENKLKVILKNKNMGTANNLSLGIISSQTLVLTKLNSQCYKAIDTEDKNNIFTMCKIR